MNGLILSGMSEVENNACDGCGAGVIENLVHMTISGISEAENEQSERSECRVNHTPAPSGYCCACAYAQRFLLI